MPYIGNTIRAADDYRLIDDISSSFNGSTTSFALQVAGSAPVPFPKSPQQVLISVNGVIQEPDPTGASGFNLVGTNIVFSSAPTNGHAFFGIIYATADYLNSGGNFPSGSLGAPSITFIGDEDSGLYRKGAGSVGFVSDATEIANFDSNGITISSGNIIIPDSIIHNGDPNTKIRFPTSDIVSVETSGSERLRVDASGRLLLGTTTPRSPASTTTIVQLEGTDASSSSFAITRNSANTGGPKFILNKTRGTSVGADTVVNSGDTLGTIQWVGNDGTDSDNVAAEIRAAVDGTPGSNDMPGRLVFSTTADGANSSTERMRIDSSGNIGIGTSSPSGAALHISKGAAVVKVETTTGGNSARVIIKSPADSYAGLHFGDDSDDDVGRIRYYHSSNFMQFVTDTSERMRIVGSKIGIGTTSPDQTLHVHKASAGSASSDSNAVITVENNTHCILQMLSPAANSNRIMFGDPSDSNAGEINYDHNINSLILKTDASEALRITANQQLLIGTGGTRSPGSVTGQFQIEGTNVGGSAMSITRNSNDSGGCNLTFNKTRGTSVGADVAVNSGDTIAAIRWCANDGSNSDNTAAFITGQVDGSTGTDDVPGRLLFGTAADGSNSSTERMRITSAGNVGIGTTTPAGKMHVNSAENTATFLAEGEVDNPAYPSYCFSGQNNDNGSRGTGMYLPGDNQLAFATVATERLRIDANGNFDFNNGALMTSYGGDTNIDHVWHNDTDNTWIFNSDTTLKATTGTSKLRCAGVDFGDSNNNADILDEYEEGSWTPELRFGGGTTGITYTSLRSGNYTKVGRVVTVNFGFKLTSKGSSTGHAEIHGLPFSAADLITGTTVENNGVCAFWDNVDPNLYAMFFHTNGSHIEIKVIHDDTDAVDKIVDATETIVFQNDTSLRGSLTYFTST